MPSSQSYPLCRMSFHKMTAMLLGVFVFLLSTRSLSAATFTVVNKCSYTVYPGIYPAVYSNGGWQLNPGASVSFGVSSTFNGRIWGRIGCNGSSPAMCSTGQCGGTGLQCAGTTGATGTSLAEFNLNANGTDYYDVSYVDGFDNPIGIQVSNSSCTSTNVCSTTPVSRCPAGELSNGDCLSPCTAFNTDQYCCRGAYGTAASCVVANWPAAQQAYVSNIHNSCPGEYSYAYDDKAGLQTCPTGSNYTVTFCPGGSASTNLNGAHTLTPQNATNSRLDDFAASTAAGNQIDIYPSNNSAAQSFVFSNNGVSPAGSYNIAVSLGAYCITASGAGSTSGVVLEPCNGSPAQAWNAVPSGNFFTFNPANNPSLCLDVRGNATAPYTAVQVYTCNGGPNEQWAVN